MSHAPYKEDPYFLLAYERVGQFFDQNRDRVFYGRQIEIRFESEFLHWITNRAVKRLVDSGLIRIEAVKLSWGGTINVYWHRSFRYYKNSLKKLVQLVEEFSRPEIMVSVGDQGELLMIDAFSSKQFLITGRDVNSHNGIKWGKSNHDLDLIVEKDGRAYGVEIKNTLGYMDQEEFNIKVAICEKLKLIPLFVNRMIPGHWAKSLIRRNGFALTMKYQLYPRSMKELVSRLDKELGLPVGCPRRLEDGTIMRFVNWHNKNL